MDVDRPSSPLPIPVLLLCPPVTVTLNNNNTDVGATTHQHPDMIRQPVVQTRTDLADPSITPTDSMPSSMMYMHNSIRTAHWQCTTD